MNINFQQVINKAQKHTDVVPNVDQSTFNISLIIIVITYRIHSTLIKIAI